MASRSCASYHSSAREFLVWLQRRRVVMLVMGSCFVLSGLIVNCLQLCSLPLYLLSRTAYRHVNTRLVYLHWSVLPWAMETWAGYTIRAYADPKYNMLKHCNMESALCVINHRGDLEWMAGFCLIDRIGMLGGAKAIMKDVAKYIPGLGWTFLFMEYPTLKRNWKLDKDRIPAQCCQIKDYPVPMMICFSPEGTRFTQEKYEKSVSFAKSRGLPVLKHHLFPHTRGFSCVLRAMKDVVPAVYDVTFAYRPGPEPSVMGMLNAVPCEIDCIFRRFLTADIPTDSDESSAKWLIKLYQEKDDLVAYHMHHGTFPAPELHLPKRVWPSVVVAVWLTILIVPVLVFCWQLMWNGAWLTLLLIALLLLACDRVLQMMARLTETASASRYGLDDFKKNR